MSGVAGDSDGDNFNSSWANIRVESKLEPVISCPPDIAIPCTDDPNDTNATGHAIAGGICSVALVSYEDDYDRGYNKACNYGELTRTWYIDLDGDGSFDKTEPNCEQSTGLMKAIEIMYSMLTEPQ